jgi:hypothetical protein
MIDLKNFKRSIGKPLIDAGFQYRGRTWYLDSSEVIALLNLQPSNYMSENFVNLAFLIKSMDPHDIPPKEEKCHVQIRADAAFSDIADDIKVLFDPKSNLDEGAQIAGINDVVSHRFLPFLLDGITVKGLKNMIDGKRFVGGWVLKPAIERLIKARET